MTSTTGNGWTAQIELEYEAQKNRTVLSLNRHSGPLVVQRPFYPEDDLCHTYILHPPGGVVGGDRLEIDVRAGEGTAVLLTTPGATKFYRSVSEKAIQNQRIEVSDGAMLEWFPQDNILFPGADAEISTRVDLASEAQFMGWEILCLGLPANGQRFSTGRADTSLTLYRDGKPVLLDRLRVDGKKDLDAAAGLRGFPVTASFVATGGTKELLDFLRSVVPHEKDALCGTTLVDGLLVTRYLGNSTFAVQALFTEIWTMLRPIITGRNACAPRIWAT